MYSVQSPTEHGVSQGTNVKWSQCSLQRSPAPEVPEDSQAQRKVVIGCPLAEPHPFRETLVQAVVQHQAWPCGNYQGHDHMHPWALPLPPVCGSYLLHGCQGWCYMWHREGLGVLGPPTNDVQLLWSLWNEHGLVGTHHLQDLRQWAVVEKFPHSMDTFMEISTKLDSSPEQQACSWWEKQYRSCAWLIQQALDFMLRFVGFFCLFLFLYFTLFILFASPTHVRLSTDLTGWASGTASGQNPRPHHS